jgi:predicted nucleic acid-binding protein
VNFVLGASVALLRLVPQTNPDGAAYADSVLCALKESQAVVPSLFGLETANVVAKVEGKGIVSQADSQRFIALLGQLDIAVDPETMARALGDTLNLARRYRLSAYDAAYLELALRKGLPLATLDADLAQAAARAGLHVFAVH